MRTSRLLVFSDLHLEHGPTWSIPRDLPGFDVAVVAGDVAATPEASVAVLATAPGLAGRPVVYVPGNHEYYGGTIEPLLRRGRDAARGTGVRLLERESAIVDGVRFVGTTLWTDYRLLGNEAVAKVACQNGLKDASRIRTDADGAERRFLSERAQERHALDLAFVEAELARDFAGLTVVVTHHAPHRGSVDPRYAADPLSAGYASHLEHVIVAGAPELWVHGHVHASYDYEVEGTRIVCNPKGYGPTRDAPRFGNPGFDPRMVVEVGGARPGRGDAR